MLAHCLSIAGVDPSGGAGLLADVKTFSALGAYGMGVVAALTAQNTQGVTGVQAVAPDFIVQQIDALYADIRVDTVKLGMLGTAETVIVVARALRRHEARRLVVDPVMVAKSGHHLLTPDAVNTLRQLILPLAEIITPNLPEAGVLLGRHPPQSVDEMRTAARDLHRLGPQMVLLKGGHLDGPESIDVFDDGLTQVELRSSRVTTKNTHGTGCTLSAAIAALLPQHANPLDAIREAKAWLTTALVEGAQLHLGRGQGPVHHFHAWWPSHPLRKR